MASYGHEMEFTSTCPKCEEISDFGIDLRTILESISVPDYSTPVVNGDVSIHFKPLTYKEQNDNSLVQFQDQYLVGIYISVNAYGLPSFPNISFTIHHSTDPPYIIALASSTIPVAFITKSSVTVIGTYISASLHFLPPNRSSTPSRNFHLRKPRTIR